MRDDLRRHRRARRLLADIGAPLGIDARLAERVEFQPALDPREAISEWRRHVVELVRVAPVQTGLQPAISGADFVGAEILWPNQNSRCAGLPAKITWAKLLDLAPDRLIGGLPHARRAVRRAAGHRDQDVLLRPSAFGEHLAELAGN